MHITAVWSIVAAIIVAAGLSTPSRARPVPNHYYDNHAADAFSATRIEGLLNKGLCQEIRAYSCQVKQKSYWLCAPAGSPMMTVNGSKYLVWVGVIIGMKTDPPLKLTGFAANWFYWQRALAADGCTEYVRMSLP